MTSSADGVRQPYVALKQWLEAPDPTALTQKAHDAEGVFPQDGHHLRRL